MRPFVLAAALVACLAPAAHAGSDSTYVGGCSLGEVREDPLHPGYWIAEIDVEAVVYSPTPEANPVWATFTCHLEVNGVAQQAPAFAANGAVAVVGGGPVTYAMSDYVLLCQRVDFIGPGDTTPTVDFCHTRGLPWEPWPIVDPLVDPVVCPVLAALQGTYGPVSVNEQGDVYVDGVPYYDCPPYDVIWPRGGGKRMMREAVLAGLVGSVLTLGAPDAQAGSDSRHEGGCSFTTFAEDPRHPDHWITEIDIEAVAYSPAPASNPVWVTVTCYLRVNGVEQPGAVVAASGAVAVVGGGPVTFESDWPSDYVDLCHRIDFTGPGDTTPTVEGCPGPGCCDEFSPWEVIDPKVCPVLAATHGTYGPVFVNEQGDVYVDGVPYFDCPPYDVIWP